MTANYSVIAWNVKKFEAVDLGLPMIALYQKFWQSKTRLSFTEYKKKQEGWNL